MQVIIIKIKAFVTFFTCKPHFTAFCTLFSEFRDKIN